jgi:two-component system, NtrC family, response regulator AtoC
MILNSFPLITQDPQMHQILKLVRQVAMYHSSVLISGESGTGKDLIAHLIHMSGSRREKPFVKVDCASIPLDLIESELFGHEKGSFTGAIQQRIGRFELADSGIVFLDQIGELPLQVQTKLTRVLQDKCFERLGSNETINVDIQIISATPVQLNAKIKESSFREELYYRLSIVPIHLPPLRDRKGDVPLLTKYFLDKFAAQYNRTPPKLHPKALEMLCNYYWPGNVRELEHLMERMIINFNENDEILPDQIPIVPEEMTTRIIDSLAEQSMSLQEVEKYYIQRILHKTKGNKSLAASLLGINRKTLLEKRRRYNIE